MVFSKLLDTITSAFDSPTRKNIRQRNVRPINELQQGMNLLQKRKQILNGLSNSSLLESMSSSTKTFQSGKDKLNSVSKAELDLLKKMETDFNKSLSAYSQKYKSFMKIILVLFNKLKNVKQTVLQNTNLALLKLGVLINKLVKVDVI